MKRIWFFGFLMALIEHVSKPLVVILDNVFIHNAKKLKPHWYLLEVKGMRFYFLPPYSLVLNPIELLRHKSNMNGCLLRPFVRTNLNRLLMKSVMDWVLNTR